MQSTNEIRKDIRASKMIAARALNTLHSYYDIKEYPLGHGSFGWVYAGEEATGDEGIATRKKVAIKILETFPREETESKQLLREITILRILHHPNIIELKRVVASYSSDGNFIGMALIFNCYDTDLDKVIRSSQELNQEHIQCFIFQLLEGANYMHSAGVVHRDIKPANILINSDCRLVFCDFGLARSTHDLSERNHPAGVSSQLFHELTDYVVTRWYRAPELVLQNSNAGEAPADIWSIGCILAELVLRRPLFEGATDARVLMGLILYLLGTPPVDKLAWIDKQKCRDWFYQTPRVSATIDDYFKDGPLRCLLKKLLQFNPAERETAEQGLRHPFLSRYRNTQRLTFSLEALSPEKRCFLDKYYTIEKEFIGRETSPELIRRTHDLIGEHTLPPKPRHDRTAITMVSDAIHHGSDVTSSKTSGLLGKRDDVSEGASKHHSQDEIDGARLLFPEIPTPSTSAQNSKRALSPNYVEASSRDDKQVVSLLRARSVFQPDSACSGTGSSSHCKVLASEEKADYSPGCAIH